MKWLNNLLKDAPAESASAAVSVPLSESPDESLVESGGEAAAVPVADEGETAEAAVNAASDATAPSTGSSAEPPATNDVPVPDFDAQFDKLLERQLELQRLFESRIHSDEVQGKALEKLHDELRSYKSNFIRQELLPFFKDVIFCHDFLAGEINRLASGGDAPNDNNDDLRALDHARQMLVDLLFKYDIEPYRGEGDQFDPKTQQCTKTMPTEIADKDKKIAAAVLPGFKSPDTILRREQVTVYKYKSP